MLGELRCEGREKRGEGRGECWGAMFPRCSLINGGDGGGGDGGGDGVVIVVLWWWWWWWWWWW